MFFTKEDRDKLDLIFRIVTRNDSSKWQLKEEKLIEDKLKKLEEDIVVSPVVMVSGGNNYDNIVSAEEEEIMDNISTRINSAAKNGDNFMYPEEMMTAEELEMME